MYRWTSGLWRFALPIPLLFLFAGTAAAGSRGGQERPANGRDCLILALYHEARTESRESILKHAWIIVWRVKRNDYPNSICGVVFQPYAFQPFNNGRLPGMPDKAARARVAAIADEVLTKAFPDAHGGAVCAERDIHTGTCIATRADFIKTPLSVATHYAVADCFFLGRRKYRYTRNKKGECVPRWSLKMNRIAAVPCARITKRPCKIIFWRQN
jgi:hypothetical protein